MPSVVPPLEPPVIPSGVPPDLADLPRSRGHLRWLTAFALGVTLAASAAMGFGLRHEAVFALRSGAPLNIGALSRLSLSGELGNEWVRADAVLGEPSVEYRRPFESATFRLAPEAGASRVFVQVQVPAASEGFVMPRSFVGRLIPLGQLGIYHQGLRTALAARFGEKADGAWVLLDGEAPTTSRWALGLSTLCVAFFLFASLGLVTLFWPSVRARHEEANVQAA